MISNTTISTTKTVTSTSLLIGGHEIAQLRAMEPAVSDSIQGLVDSAAVRYDVSRECFLVTVFDPDGVKSNAALAEIRRAAQEVAGDVRVEVAAVALVGPTLE